ncbi:hypothetical protein [Nitrincola sp. A-D6]|uniref:hypothetical protein n=1 Tax=Nitrincola sp. A-D6 TaxID=1545442 RepID=UPI0013646273|nr:hypothetical protein [Nitrincola sp. A-D6]
MAEAAEAKNKIVGSSFGNIPLAGHAAMEDAPETIGKLVCEFLINPRKVQIEA